METFIAISVWVAALLIFSDLHKIRDEIKKISKESAKKAAENKRGSF